MRNCAGAPPTVREAREETSATDFCCAVIADFDVLRATAHQLTNSRYSVCVKCIPNKASGYLGKAD